MIACVVMGKPCTACEQLPKVEENPRNVIERAGFEHLAVESEKGDTITVRCKHCNGSFEAQEMPEMRMGDIYNWMWSSWRAS